MCTRFFSADSSSACSIACCLLFLALKRSFSGIFMVFFYIILLSKGARWNPIDMKLIPILCWLPKDQVFATNSFSLQHSFVCIVATTHHRRPFVSPPSSDFLPFFPLICSNLRCMKETLSLNAFHFRSNRRQQSIKPSLISRINSSLRTICLCLKDAKMAVVTVAKLFVHEIHELIA